MIATMPQSPVRATLPSSSMPSTELSETTSRGGVGLIGRPATAPGVLSAVHGDRTILLNLRTERYLGLDEVGSTVWHLVEQAGQEGIALSALVGALAARYRAPLAVLEQDLGELLNRLLADGVIDGVAPACAPLSPQRPSALGCALALLGATLALRVLGLRRSLVVVEWLGRKVSLVRSPTPEFLTGVVHKLDAAAAFFPGRALCLERSFALYALFRWAGVRARLRIGAQPYPFAAHAWVEYDGRPVGESPDGIGRFIPFEGLGV